MPLLREVHDLTALRTRARRLLCVLPHPDDEAYGCAGALARAGADPDAAAVLLTLTNGEASSMGARLGLAPAEVGALRARRLEQVAAITRLDGLLLPGLPDGALARLDLQRVAAPIRAALEAFAPQVVVLHDARGVNGHPDHIATHFAVRRAAEGLDLRLALVAYPPATAEAARPRLLFATPEEEIDATLTLTEDEIDAKEACLRAHEALVTLKPGGSDDLALRPPVEHYDLLGEAHAPPLLDLFEGLSGTATAPGSR